MGYMRHHTIVVCSWDEKLLALAHTKAEAIFPYVSTTSPPAMNGYAAFFIPPDGSKEGWDDSIRGDNRRQRFLDWCEEQRYGDGSTSLDWVEVQFGDDEKVSKVTHHSDEYQEGAQ